MDKYAQYHADIGLVCPIKISSKDYSCDLYQECPIEIQKLVINSLKSEWGQEYTHEYVLQKWNFTNTLYILYTTALIGFIGIDRQHFYPFISHLYVCPLERGKGYSKHLIYIGESYIKSMTFDKARLWCKKHLIDYYIGMGWEIEKQESNENIMVKTLL